MTYPDFNNAKKQRMCESKLNRITVDLCGTENSSAVDNIKYKGRRRPSDEYFHLVRSDVMGN